jgi:hypothetical protein
VFSNCRQEICVFFFIKKTCTILKVQIKILNIKLKFLSNALKLLLLFQVGCTDKGEGIRVFKIVEFSQG